MYLVTAYIYHYILIRLLKHNSKGDIRYISLCRLLFPYTENIADELSGGSLKKHGDSSCECEIQNQQKRWNNGLTNALAYP